MGLTKQDINNILNIMSRADLKGNEATAYAAAEMKLRVLFNTLNEEPIQPQTQTPERPITPALPEYDDGESCGD